MDGCQAADTGQGRMKCTCLVLSWLLAHLKFNASATVAIPSLKIQGLHHRPRTTVSRAPSQQTGPVSVPASNSSGQFTRLHHALDRPLVFVLAPSRWPRSTSTIVSASLPPAQLMAE